MTHTLLAADRATHLKILAMAAAGTIAAALVGMNAGLSGTDTAAGRAQASSAIVKAAKPAVSAALDDIALRSAGFTIAKAPDGG